LSQHDLVAEEIIKWRVQFRFLGAFMGGEKTASWRNPVSLNLFLHFPFCPTTPGEPPSSHQLRGKDSEVESRAIKKTLLAKTQEIVVPLHFQ